MNKKISGHLDAQCYGVTTLGERGQIVIPNELRQALRLRSGDKLLVFSRFDKLIALVKATELESFLNYMMKKFGPKIIPAQYRSHLAKAKTKKK
ncbi:MAG: AbrB/MazE/SpoVT family DNA-binding domain-containing protein [Candidatus Buchananbacteria bacterium]